VRRRAFSRPAERPAFGGALFAPERAFPKTGLVVRRRSEATCRTPGRFNRTRSGLPERKAGGGFRRIPNQERQPFRAPGRAATAYFQMVLVRVCPVGVPRPGALPRSSVGCADPKNPAQLLRSRIRAALAVRRGPCLRELHRKILCHLASSIVIFQVQRFRAFGSPWWASGGRPPRLRIPRGPRTAVRVLAGLSSAFPRPSLGRSAGRGNALCCLDRGFMVSDIRFFGYFLHYPQTAQTPKRYPPKAAPIQRMDRLGTVWGGVSSPNGPVWGVWGVCTVWGVWPVWGFSVC